jgi:hypothetical protein
VAIDLPPPPPALYAHPTADAPAAEPSQETSRPIGMMFRERVQQVAQGTSTSTPGTSDITNNGDVRLDPADGDTD